ncbi:MAG: hypothetical protein ACJ70Y_05625 [Nitrososphaera sp.]
MVDHYGGDDNGDGGDNDNNNDDGQWQRRNQPVEEFVINNFALDRKIKEYFKGLMPESQWLKKLELESDEDNELLADFILQRSDHSDGAMMSPNAKRVSMNLVALLGSDPIAHVWRAGLTLCSTDQMFETLPEMPCCYCCCYCCHLLRLPLFLLSGQACLPECLT